MKHNKPINNLTMAVKTVTIPKQEYIELKKHKKLDQKLVKQLIRSLEDIKAGKVTRVL